jgi:hypothetical protein
LPEYEMICNLLSLKQKRERLWIEQKVFQKKIVIEIKWQRFFSLSKFYIEIIRSFKGKIIRENLCNL